MNVMNDIGVVPNFYDFGWNAYVDGKSCPSKFERNAYDGWKDARLCHSLDGKLPAKMD